MLALVEDNLGITPDYETSLSSLLTDFAMRSLHAGDLSVLHASGIQRTHGMNQASFVPCVGDWNDLALPLNAPQLQFCTATKYPVTIAFTASTAFSIKGTRVDAISRMTNIMWDVARAQLFDTHNNFRAWASAPGVSGLGHLPTLDQMLDYPYYLGISVYRDIMTMEVGGKDPFEYSLRRTSQAEFRIWDVEATIRPYTKHRNLFQTKQGYLGIGPSCMKPDDQVVIFDGGVTPFIIRKVDSNDGELCGSWQLVGDCFLLGWMKGDYFGHTVVDEIPAKTDDNVEGEGDSNVKYLVREFFTLV
jgi:hypothetical protein